MARTLTGEVSSNKGLKTIVVVIKTRKTHPLYKKQYSVSNKIMAHDENNDAKIGDKVIITECRPLSARKRWTLLKIVEKARVKHTEPEPSDTKAVEDNPEPEEQKKVPKVK